MVELGDLEGIRRMALPAFPVLELVAVWLAFLVTDSAAFYPFLDLRPVMLEGVQEEGCCGMAQLTGRTIESALMGVLFPVACPAVIWVSEPELEDALSSSF